MRVLKTPDAFKAFLRQVEETNFETNTTAAGTLTIQQTTRNKLRAEGVEALREDLIDLYGDEFDIVTTKEGIIIIAELEDGQLFSWEIKNTIKALDYNPYFEADKYDNELSVKANRAAQREAEKAQRIKLLEEKRARKLAKLEAINNQSSTK